MKTVESGIDSYELEVEDIHEAIQDLMKKRGYDETVNIWEKKVHVPGEHYTDEGHDIMHYMVKVKRGQQ